MSLVDTTTGEIVESLTEDEAARLRHKERVIERGANEVAQALTAIRDERLYRAEYRTFESYCRERWGMSRAHADRQIVAAEVAEALTPIGVTVPESQARELADLRDDPDAIREAYQAAHDATDGNVTAAAIRAARNPQSPEPAESGEADAGSGQTPQDAPLRGSASQAEAHRPAEASAAERAEPAPSSPQPERAAPSSSPAPSDGLTDFVASSPDVVQAAWRRRFMDAIARSGELMLFTPADVAEKADVELINELERLSLDLNNYVSRVRAKRPARLTSIRGGAQ